MPLLSVTIIVLNEEANISRCLSSVKGIAAEIIVVDSGSTDRTIEICRRMDCKIYDRPFDGYGKQKQFAVDMTQNDWILSIDADEEITPGLADEIRKLMAQEPDASGYRFRRRLVYLGRVMKYSGVGKEYILRLFNKRNGEFTDVPVHEEIVVKGKTGMLSGDLFHYSYSNIANQIEKTNRYTTFAAGNNQKLGKHYRKLWVALKFPVTFFTVYVLKGGFLDGYPGFFWSFLAAFYGSLKIAKTIELEKKLS